MAYKFSKGEREFGDIEYEDDPEKDTKIDFDDNFIALVTSGSRSSADISPYCFRLTGWYWHPDTCCRTYNQQH